MDYVLATKMYVPATQPYHIRRKDLEDRFAKGLHGKLTLISAPAGFGKTMLMSEMAGAIDSSPGEGDQPLSAWVSLDMDDNDPARFLTYLCASLAGCGALSASFNSSAEQIINTPKVPHLEIITAVINELAALGRKTILFLDDFHCIESPGIFELVSFLIEQSPDWFHLVISTRDDPPLPVARLRARGQLNEFRASDLRFRTGEISSLLERIEAPEMNRDERQSLETMSEGWITGIILALISSRSHGLPETKRYALDYLMSEVLSGLDDDVRDFLIRTSFLDRFSSQLCNTVTDSGEAEATLELILKSNLFLISLDGQGKWFRYHHLFRELLYDQFKELPEKEMKNCRLKAGLWFAGQNLPEEALEHLIAAEDWDSAAALLETFGIDGSSGKGIIWKWLDVIPDDIAAAKPDLSILRAWRYFTSGRAEEASRCLDDADRLVESLELEESASARISGRSSVIKSFIESFEGNLRGTIEHASRAMEILPESDKIWKAIASIALGDSVGMTGNMDKAIERRFEALEDCEKAENLYLILLSAMKLALTLRLRGDLEQVKKLCAKYASLAEERHLSGLPVAGWLKSILAEVLAETGEIDKALELCMQAVDQIILTDDVVMFVWSRLCLMRIRYIKGEFDEVELLIRHMEETVKDRSVPTYIDASLSAWKIRLLLRSERFEEAAAQCRKRKLSAEDKINTLNVNEYISYARMLLYSNRIGDCRALLSKLLEMAREGRWLFREIEILLISSLAAQKKGSVEEAGSFLNEALAKGRNQGFHAIYLAEGEALLNNSDLKELTKGLNPIRSEYSGSGTSKLIEPLSDRELEVLQCLSEGLSRQQIADTLFLSPHTVKAHLRNIYGKLDVNSATQAVAKARQYELIS